MAEQPSRTLRQVAIADHLWETLEKMSFDMAVDRESLINQALFAFSRSNGYTGQVTRPAAEPAPMSAVPSPAPGAAPAPMPAPMPAYIAPPAPAPVVAPAIPAPAPVVVAPPPMVAAPPAIPAAYAAPARAPVDEATPPTGVPAAAPAPRFDPPPVVEAPLDTGSRLPRLGTKPPPAPTPEAPPRPAIDEVRAAQERVLQKAAELERQVRSAAPDEGTPSPMPAPAPEGPTLVLYAEGREVDRVSGNRFLIGRGKHCDLIINSGKVSREHAAITRESDGFYIEDLGSSNGTWFDKKRITRRRIEDGDDYFVCSEKLTCRVQ